MTEYTCLFQYLVEVQTDRIVLKSYQYIFFLDTDRILNGYGYESDIKLIRIRIEYFLDTNTNTNIIPISNSKYICYVITKYIAIIKIRRSYLIN